MNNFNDDIRNLNNEFNNINLNHEQDKKINNLKIKSDEKYVKTNPKPENKCEINQNSVKSSRDRLKFLLSSNMM